MLDIDELFRKLKPVFGDKITELWSEYQLNPNERKEIEGILKILASNHLNNNYEKKSIILDPPPKEIATGEYSLGTVYYGNKPYCQFGLREDELIQHIGIFGRTGSGKTNCGFLIIQNFIEKDKPFLIFDWKRNYRDILGIDRYKDSILVCTIGRNISPFYFNPLIPPQGTQPTIWLKKIIEIMCHVYWLGEGVAYLLQKAMDSVYSEFGIYEGNVNNYPNLSNVKKWLENYKAKGREAQWMDSTLRVVGTLCYGEVGKVLNVSKAVKIEDLLKKNVIFELDALTNSDKTFFIESLLLWIHHYRMQDKDREKFKHAIIIEEAHHILMKKQQAKESIIDITLREIRELGEAIILIDQHPSLISVPSIGNTYCTIAMNLKHSHDITTISNAIMLEIEKREFLGKLKTGYGIVRLQGRWFKPFLVKFPLFQIKKGYIKDEDLKRKFGSYLEKSGDVQAEEGKNKDIKVIKAEAKIDNISELEKEMLLDVITNKTSGIVERLNRLSINPYQGNKVIDSLSEKNLLTIKDIPTYKGRIKYLYLTEKGVEVLSKFGYKIEPQTREGGIEHEYWKSKIAEHFKTRGYKVEVEKPIGEGRTIDLVVSKNGTVISIEIETGMSDTVNNVRKCIEARMQEILCITTTKNVKNNIQEKLRKSGMSLNDKVKVMWVKELLET